MSTRSAGSRPLGVVERAACPPRQPTQATSPEVGWVRALPPAPLHAPSHPLGARTRRGRRVPHAGRALDRACAVDDRRARCVAADSHERQTGQRLREALNEPGLTHPALEHAGRFDARQRGRLRGSGAGSELIAVILILSSSRKSMVTRTKTCCRRGPALLKSFQLFTRRSSGIDLPRER